MGKGDSVCGFSHDSEPPSARAPVWRRRTGRSSSPPLPARPPLQTIRLDIPLGGPEDYEIDIRKLSKDTGQRPPTPPRVLSDVGRDESSESEPEERNAALKPKKKRKRVMPMLPPFEKSDNDLPNNLAELQAHAHPIAKKARHAEPEVEVISSNDKNTNGKASSNTNDDDSDNIDIDNDEDDNDEDEAKAVTDEVLRTTENKQQPHVYGTLPDQDFFFRR